MIEKRFPSILERVIFVDTGRKLTREEIIKQMINQEPIINDEEAFLRHLIRRWEND